MANSGRSSGLHIIFSFFLGLMLTAFAGVGVYTFYPPNEEFNEQIRDLRRQEELIRDSRAADQLTEEERAQIREINTQRYAIEDAVREAQRPWGRNTSIILMVVATLAMVISLVKADRLLVISNGLLLGGVFTMLYGVGWIIATDPSKARFVVMTIALLITLGLGYLRFVQRGKPAGGVGADGAPDAMGQPEIELRLNDLEKRIHEAARALGDTRSLE
jgi:hypothetical protein